MAISNLTMFLNLLVASFLVYADVIREDGYNNYEGQFTVVHKERMLRVLMYFNNIKQEECALHCVRHLRCRTFNYHLVKRACELTDGDFNELDGDKISSGWYNHGTPPKVNGGWSIWKNYTECTKKCGNGTLEQWRDCDSPKPEFGGAHCKGRMRRRVKCNTHECPVVNFALKKTATQSSLYSSTHGPSQAVDGNTGTKSITKWNDIPWWKVDLGSLIAIKEISLNAFHTANNHNRGLLVETRQSKDEKWMLCSDIGDIKKRVTKFTCDEQTSTAQFLRIRSTKKCYLYIFEIEIFGYMND